MFVAYMCRLCIMTAKSLIYPETTFEIAERRLDNLISILILI